MANTKVFRCEPCRRGHRRCDGDRPVCGHCARTQNGAQNCQYSSDRAPPNRNYPRARPTPRPPPNPSAGPKTLPVTPVTAPLTSSTAITANGAYNNAGAAAEPLPQGSPAPLQGMAEVALSLLDSAGEDTPVTMTQTAQLPLPPVPPQRYIPPSRPLRPLLPAPPRDLLSRPSSGQVHPFVVQASSRTPAQHLSAQSLTSSNPLTNNQDQDLDMQTPDRPNRNGGGQGTGQGRGQPIDMHQGQRQNGTTTPQNNNSSPPAPTHAGTNPVQNPGTTTNVQGVNPLPPQITNQITVAPNDPRWNHRQSRVRRIAPGQAQMVWEYPYRPGRPFVPMTDAEAQPFIRAPNGDQLIGRQPEAGQEIFGSGGQRLESVLNGGYTVEENPTSNAGQAAGTNNQGANGDMNGDNFGNEFVNRNGYGNA